MMIAALIIVYLIYQVLKKPANNDINLTIGGYTSTPMRYRPDTRQEKIERILIIKHQVDKGHLSTKKMQQLIDELKEIDS